MVYTLSKCRVLVIDDEEDIRVLTSVFLEMDGRFSVTAASSGTEGLAIAGDSRPDVILLDYMMTDIDGPAVLTALKAGTSTNDIPVIFLSAKIQGLSDEAIFSLGAQGAIAKPFDPGSLADDVARIIGMAK